MADALIGIGIFSSATFLYDLAADQICNCRRPVVGLDASSWTSQLFGVIMKIACGMIVGLLALTMLALSGCNTSSFKDWALFRPSPSDEPTFEERANRDPDASNVTLTVWHHKFEDAKAASAESGKPILANFTGSDWCGWCVKLKKDVFRTDEFEQWARDNVILLELDYPKNASQTAEIRQQNMELKARYRINGYPTVLLLASNGDPIGRLGYMDNPDSWIASAQSKIGATRVASEDMNSSMQ